MRTFDLTEDQAITAITTLVDFGITQVTSPSLCIVSWLPWRRRRKLISLVKPTRLIKRLNRAAKIIFVPP